MNRPNTLRLLRAGLLAGAVLLLMPSFAEAQFRGDMFFAQPSQAVAEDGTATFEVLLFAGADVVGATHFDVVFDPVLAEIVGVEAGTTEQLAPGHVAVTSPGRAAVVDLNATSLTQPIGTASLARITLRPLAPAGTRVPLSIQVRSVLRQDSGAVASRGFSGEMVVVSALGAASRTAAARAAAPADDADHVERALAFRRPGQVVDLVDLAPRAGGYGAVLHRVVVPDPAAPSEMPVE